MMANLSSFYESQSLNLYMKKDKFKSLNIRKLIPYVKRLGLFQFLLICMDLFLSRIFHRSVNKTRHFLP